MIEKAIALALDAHEGQVDKYGAPYILHPLHLMMQMDTDAERMAAVLHDTIEDTKMTLDDLRTAGFPEEVVEAVGLLTHREDEMGYQAYVRQLKPNPIARKVKMADLEHNMDVRRMDEVTERDAARLERYRLAWETLVA